MNWLILFGAILAEVCGTLCLKVAATGRPRYYVVVASGYILAFSLLAVLLGRGFPLGVAYGVWAASGIALTALASRPLFHEPLTRTMLVGIGLIAGGVLVIELGASL